MKRKVLLIMMTGLFLLLMTFGVFSRHGGAVRNVSREVGASEKFTPGEIEEAMDAAQQYFKKEFDGCKLISLSSTPVQDVAPPSTPPWPASMI